MNLNPTETHPLIKLYGDSAFDLAAKEISELAKNSNIPFTQDYLKLGTSFTALNAKRIVEGEEKARTLKDLIAKSFGEAAVYKYNVMNAE